MPSATDWLARISANVDDFFANRISHDEFGRRNRALWDAIDLDGKKDAVSQLISREQKAAGLFTRGLADTALVTWNGVVGRAIRRDGVGRDGWILIETAAGVRLSWPARETMPVAMAREAAAAPLPSRSTMASALGLKPGDRIELLAMPDDPNPVPVGTRGTVEWANDVDFGRGDRFTQVSVRWDSGRSLMLSIPPDRVRKV